MQRTFVRTVTFFSFIPGLSTLFTKSIENVELAVSVMEQRVETDAAMSRIRTIPSSMFGRFATLSIFGTT